MVRCTCGRRNCPHVGRWQQTDPVVGPDHVRDSKGAYHELLTPRQVPWWWILPVSWFPQWWPGGTNVR